VLTEIDTNLLSSKFFSEDNMSKIDIKYQVLPPDHLTHVQTSVRSGRSVAGEDLLLAIEQGLHRSLPEDLRNIVRQAHIPAVESKGRPKKFGATLDLALDKLDRRYPALLRYEQRKKERLLKRGKAALKGESPSLLAYDRLLRHMKDEFGPMTREGLANMHSKYRNGHFHSADNHVDSEDFDAEIERQFPAP
jgi:hypothetical protein